MATFHDIGTGVRGYSICKKIQTIIKTQRKEVSHNQNVRIAVRLKNRSGGDVDNGQWYLLLPEGLEYVSSSLPSLKKIGDRLLLDPLMIYTKKSITFTIIMKVLPMATGRLVFHSFLHDPHTDCKRVSSATVSSAVFVSLHVQPCFPSRSTMAVMPDFSFPLFCSFHLSWSSKVLERRGGGGPSNVSSFEGIFKTMKG